MKRTKEQLATYNRNKRLVYERDGWKCRHCNRREGLTPHHVVYQSRQGSDDLNNLMTLCLWCHNDIHDHRLKIEIILKTATDLVVKFWRKTC
jgi:5-methylcytosine-specific restriction endonuclease McrA